ncbi:hypothetical protein J7I80_12675 [Bacillus sp. ISL-41]|uniref:hypothetical protein n=1 Tax=Bacillus sp. ISL-41 TaxID=2819127 RepID=UPI001BEA0F41|nr:hypothetical protein [Bacillus sp. ISL-41]MBT2643086.1 hypothetical protein [Bacillus sp. ISL-41]
MKNEKGYALVLVLLIITITFTFALSLSGMALSARKQFNKTDEINRATDLAEMGVAHYEALLTRIVKNANAEADQAVQKALDLLSENPNLNVPDYDDVFIKVLSDEVGKNAYLPLAVDGANSYEISNPVITTHNGKISLTFDSKGLTDNEEKELQGTLTIFKNKDSLDGDLATNEDEYDYVVWEDFDFHGGKKHTETFPGSTFFKKTVTLRGTSSLIIRGDAFFHSSVTLKGGDTIIVYGDAIFTGEVKDLKANKAKICILGTPYRIVNQNIVEYPSFDGGDTDSCPKPILDNEWSIDPDNGIEVKY